MRAVFAFVLLAGCAANPSVRYAEATSPASVEAVAPQLIDSFYLQRNDVHIELRSGADKAPELIVTDARAEDRRHRLMLLRGDRAWTRTTVSFAKIENSDLIESAGVEVEDRRVELLQAAGGVVKSLIPLMVGASPSMVEEPNPDTGCHGLPCDLPDPGALGISRAGETRGRKGGLVISWGPVSPSAVAASTFIAGLSARRSNGLYYSACRELSIGITTEVESTDLPMRQRSSWRGRIADPDWIEFVAFPRKGSLRMHSQCGVSVTTEKDPTQPVDALVSAALAQALAIKNAASGGH